MFLRSNLFDKYLTKIKATTHYPSPVVNTNNNNNINNINKNNNCHSMAPMPFTSISPITPDPLFNNNNMSPFYSSNNSIGLFDIDQCIGSPQLYIGDEYYQMSPPMQPVLNSNFMDQTINDNKRNANFENP
eukprot:218176_1